MLLLLRVDCTDCWSFAALLPNNVQPATMSTEREWEREREVEDLTGNCKREAVNNKQWDEQAARFIRPRWLHPYKARYKSSVTSTALLQIVTSLSFHQSLLLLSYEDHLFELCSSLLEGQNKIIFKIWR